MNRENITDYGAVQIYHNRKWVRNGEKWRKMKGNARGMRKVMAGIETGFKTYPKPPPTRAQKVVRHEMIPLPPKSPRYGTPPSRNRRGPRFYYQPSDQRGHRLSNQNW